MIGFAGPIHFKNCAEVVAEITRTNPHFKWAGSKSASPQIYSQQAFAAS
jgi:hypothetical protein